MVKNSKFIQFIALVLVLTLGGCDMFEYHPYDGRIRGARNINAGNIARIERACADRDTIRFILMGDSQRSYDELKIFTNVANDRGDVDFVIHAGDISDFGVTKEFTWTRDIMSRLTMPYVALIGNHDCLANGEEIFRVIFGNENFAFMAGNVKFVCLNTNAIEYDYSYPVPDFKFIKEQREMGTANHQRTVFAMHAAPFSEQFNNNVADVFHYETTRYPELLFCLNGHGHHVEVENLFGDDITYYACANIKKRSYLYFTITPDSYSYEVVEF